MGSTSSLRQTASDGTNGRGVLTRQSAADWQIPSPIWYYSEDFASLVLVAADVYDNKNNKIGTVDANTPVVAWCPANDCKVASGAMYVYNTGASIMLQAITLPVDPKGQATNGITWSGQVQPQPLFHASGQGLWAFVQIVQPNISYVEDPGVTYNYSFNGKVGLDTCYPYAPLNDKRGWPDDLTIYPAHDSPNLSLGNSVSSASFNASFQTYMMYLPVATTVGNQWVPLRRVSWNCGASVKRPHDASKNPPDAWIYAVLPWKVGDVNVTENARCKEHPLWSLVIVGGTF